MSRAATGDSGSHRWIGDDLELRVHVVPGAKRTEARGLHGSALKINVQARAVEGAANEALIGFVASELQVPRRQCVLVAGEKSREKRLLVQRPPRSRAGAVLLLWSQARTRS